MINVHYVQAAMAIRDIERGYGHLWTFQKSTLWDALKALIIISQ